MPTPVTIKRPGVADVHLLHALNRLFGRAFDDTETYEAKQPGTAWLESLLSKDHVIPLVASSGDRVVGGLVAYELDKFEQERREMYIYDLAVDEACRREGVATALIGHLRQIALARDVWVIYVQADYGDDPAIALYEKLGTREEVLHFDIEVRGGS
jgi:aminoglycoside 3-N-acetyltransferase I